MTSKITKLPTAATSYLTVRKRGSWWDVMLVTPLPMRAIKTRLYSMSDRETALGHGRETAARMQRPFRAPGGVAK